MIFMFYLKSTATFLARILKININEDSQKGMLYIIVAQEASKAPTVKVES